MCFSVLAAQRFILLIAKFSIPAMLKCSYKSNLINNSLSKWGINQGSARQAKIAWHYHLNACTFTNSNKKRFDSTLYHNIRLRLGVIKRYVLQSINHLWFTDFGNVMK